MLNHGKPFDLAVHRELLGCHWGRRIGLPDQHEECPKQAIQYVKIHGGPEGQCIVKLCDEHLKIVLELSDPHEAGEDKK